MDTRWPTPGTGNDGDDDDGDDGDDCDGVWPPLLLFPVKARMCRINMI